MARDPCKRGMQGQGRALLLLSCFLDQSARACLQAEHKLVESAWPESMRRLFGPNAVLVAPAAVHMKQRQILSQVGLPVFPACMQQQRLRNTTRPRTPFPKTRS